MSQVSCGLIALATQMRSSFCSCLCSRLHTLSKAGSFIGQACRYCFCTGLHRQILYGGLRIGLYEPVKRMFMGGDPDKVCLFHSFAALWRHSKSDIAAAVCTYCQMCQF